MNAPNQDADLHRTKRRLVDAAVTLMRRKGYNATTVDDICAAAKVTKGAFFHYFGSKEDIARAAMERFGSGADQDLHDAAFRKLADPLDRVYGRLDFIKESAGGASGITKGCLVGTFAQEMSFTNPELRRLCDEIFTRTAQDFAKDLAGAKSMHPPATEFEPEKLAVLFVSIYQGSSLLAKASGSNAVLMDNIEQFRRHLQGLFGEVRVPRPTGAMEAFDMTFD
jgi:TetR/AcrR family transcriptional repressor of nem operon